MWHVLNGGGREGDPTLFAVPSIGLIAFSCSPLRPSVLRLVGRCFGALALASPVR